MTWRDILRSKLTSRKFWALITALVAIAAGYSTGELQSWQAVQAVVAACAAYSLGEGLADNGRKA